VVSRSSATRKGAAVPKERRQPLYSTATYVWSNVVCADVQRGYGLLWSGKRHSSPCFEAPYQLQSLLSYLDAP